MRIYYEPRVCSKIMQRCALNLRKQMTPHERILWRHVRNNQLGVKFRRQMIIDDKYVVDFVCLEKKLVLEIDGSQHEDSRQDERRTSYLRKRGFKVLRFWNNEIDRNLSACLEVIYRYVQSPSPLAGEGGRSPDEGGVGSNR